MSPLHGREVRSERTVISPAEVLEMRDLPPSLVAFVPESQLALARTVLLLFALEADPDPALLRRARRRLHEGRVADLIGEVRVAL